MQYAMQYASHVVGQQLANSWPTLGELANMASFWTGLVNMGLPMDLANCWPIVLANFLVNR